jgi:hypothetical protein
MLLEIVHAVPAPLCPGPNRLTTRRHLHIRVWLWQSQQGKSTPVHNPRRCCTCMKEQRASCVGETCKKKGQPVVNRRPASPRVLAPLPETHMPWKGVVESRPQHSGLHVACVHACVHWNSGTGQLHRKNMVPLDPARQNCPGPPVSRLSVPVFLHLHLCLEVPQLVFEFRTCSCRQSEPLSLPRAHNPKASGVAARATPNRGFLLPRRSPTLPSDISARRRSGTHLLNLY